MLRWRFGRGSVQHTARRGGFYESLAPQHRGSSRDAWRRRTGVSPPEHHSEIAHAWLRLLREGSGHNISYRRGNNFRGSRGHDGCRRLGLHFIRGRRRNHGGPRLSTGINDLESAGRQTSHLRRAEFRWRGRYRNRRWRWSSSRRRYRIIQPKHGVEFPGGRPCARSCNRRLHRRRDWRRRWRRFWFESEHCVELPGSRARVRWWSRRHCRSSRRSWRRAWLEPKHGVELPGGRARVRRWSSCYCGSSWRRNGRSRLRAKHAREPSGRRACSAERHRRR